MSRFYFMVVFKACFNHIAVGFPRNPMPLLPPLFVGAVLGRHNRFAEYLRSDSEEVFRAFEFGQTRVGVDGEGVLLFQGGSAVGGLAGGEQPLGS